MQSVADAQVEWFIQGPLGLYTNDTPMVCWNIGAKFYHFMPFVLSDATQLHN